MDSQLAPVSSDFVEKRDNPRHWCAGFGVVEVWRERLFVARHCRRLRTLCIKIRTLNPALQGAALYEQVVQQHLGVTGAAAVRVVDLAAKSFASWPAPRSVTFRDVAHYLASTHLLERRGWIAADVRRVVNRRLPAEW